jgi:glycosyltransferase involved in cell wall biosynthesis
VLQVVQRPQLRGAEIFAHGLNARLRAMGHEARTVYLHPPSQTPALTVVEGDLVLRGDAGSPLRAILGVSPGLVRSLGGAIAAFGPDIVQVNGGSTVKYGAIAKRVVRRPRWALVYRNIGDPAAWLRGPLRRGYYRHVIMPMMDGIASVSEHCMRNLVRICRPGAARRVVIRGVDTERFKAAVPREEVRRNLKIPNHARVVVTVGSLSPEKRVDRLLKAFSAVKVADADARLLVVGDGPLRAALEGVSKELGIAEDVRFLGIRRDVPSLLRAADLFAIASDTEGTPGALLEAGLIGLPAVATRVGGVPECVIDGTTALLVDREDAAGLARAMLHLLRDARQARMIGEAARRHVTESFGIDRIAAEYLEFYREILSSDHAR